MAAARSPLARRLWDHPGVRPETYRMCAEALVRLDGLTIEGGEVFGCLGSATMRVRN